jgi:transcriptional regulator with XRE-family HTH domain
MWNILSDPQVLEAIGQYIKARRLDRGLTQVVLAKHAGVSLPTLQRLEGKGQAKVESLVRVLRSLRLLDALEGILQPPPVSPMALATNTKPPRVRARNSVHQGHAGRG